MVAFLCLGQAVKPSSSQAQSRDTAAYWQQDIKYTIVAGLDEPSGILAGTAQLVYHNRSPDTLSQIFFHLYLNAFRPGSLWSADEQREGIDRFAHLPDPYNAFERLGRVMIGGVAVTAAFPNAPDSTIARFDLPRKLSPGDSLVVLLEWQSRPSAIPRRQGRQGRRFDFAQGFPKVCVYDRGGWEAHPLHLAGELYGEYGTYDVTLDLAQDQVVAATGVPISGDPGWEHAKATPATTVTMQRDWYGNRPDASPYPFRIDPPAAGRKRVRFYAEHIHHFAWSANPQYRYEEGRLGPIVLRTLFLPADSASWGQGKVIARMQRAMAWLDTIWGTYPYPQVIAVHRIEGGGTEFPMMVMNGGPEESLIFHEVGHIYTYGILGNNEWKEGYLDEGFTTFQTAWNFQRRGMGTPSPVVQQIILAMDLDGWSQPIATVAENFSEFGIYNRMIYTKAQLFYEMLKYVVGEDAFRRGLHLYYERWKLRHVDEDALRRAMEQASGQDLRWFFAQWLHTVPRVDYALGSVQRWRQEDGRWHIRIIVKRKTDAIMPVDVAVPAGDTVYTARVSGARRSEAVELVTKVKPGLVTLDPALQTMDWNYLNNHERGGLLGFLGPDGPEPVERIGWSGSSPARRDRVVDNWMPLAWYNDAGGLNLGLQRRSNYLGRFDEDAFQLTYPLRRPGGSADIINGRFIFRNPTWEKVPRVRMGLDLWALEGRDGGRYNVSFDMSPHLTFGPRVSGGIEVMFMNVRNAAYVDSSLWSDVAEGTIAGTFNVHWQGQDNSTSIRVRGEFGVAGEPQVSGLGSPRTHTGASLELRHRHSLGRFEGKARVFLAGLVHSDSLGLPRQNAFYLAGASPLETFDNPFLRSRGALLVRPGVNYSAPGGAGLRGYRTDLPADWITALNLELSRPIFTRPRARVFSSFSVALFGDAAAQGANSPFVSPILRTTHHLLADGGFGLRATHRIGPTTFTTRADFPILVSEPAMAVGGGPNDGRAKFRAIWSLEESF
ncbi:MAG TPA: M1 family metallopeptidase [Gemmatimonadales bacterium]|jgi:hypothetical protein